MSHCAIFRVTYLAKALRDKSHETLHNVTYLETTENVARQVPETVAESTTRFYFLQRFQATFLFVAQSHEFVASVKACAMFRTLRDKLHKTLHSVTAP